MPISSGANAWPTAYKVFQKWKATGNSPPPPYTRTQPSPRPTYQRYPHASRPQPPPKPNKGGCCGGGPGGGGGGCGPGGGGGCGFGGGGCGGPGGPCGAPGGAEGVGPCCCFCGGSALYTTGVAGANAGCFQGGMFSSKDPAFPMGKSDYTLQNTGRHRCCACVWGTIIGLLLLGLILGLVLALDPYLKNESAVNDYLAANPGAYREGDYIIVPKDTYMDYYKVNGAEDPCNPYNNNSAYPIPTAGVDYVTGLMTTDSYVITDPALNLVPDCQDVTTSIEFTFSVLITGPTTPAATTALTPAGICLATTLGWSIAYACVLL